MQGSKPTARTNRVSVQTADGRDRLLYEPQPHQQAFHESDAPHLLALGTRKTGKSTMLRWDAILRCLIFPNFRALIIRRTIPDLRKSHLNFIEAEMIALGGRFLHGTNEAVFPNGSKIVFTHCEALKDVMNFLSSEWGFIGFDELSTFLLDMFLMICAAANATLDKPYRAVIRCASNTLGVGSQWMKAWFIDHDVNLADYPDYVAADFVTHYSQLADNKYLDRRAYEATLKNLPDHVRRSWLYGEFVTEGAYFTDFALLKDLDGVRVPWHGLMTMPTWKDREGPVVPITRLDWIGIYRTLDWGYDPDPAVCHWHAILPNKRVITFNERTWRKTLAADVAEEIKRESRGMRVLDTFADPTMFIKTGGSPFSIAETFEQHGVPLTPAQNDRELYGYSLHEWLNTLIDGRPLWQIYVPGCPELIRTLPLLQMNQTDARKIADGPDHWAISCAYLAMSRAAPAAPPSVLSTLPRWMQPIRRPRFLGVLR